MKSANALKVLTTSVLLSSMLSAQSSTKKTLEGVWKIAEIVTIGSDTTRNSDPQPSLIMFGQRHCSLISIPGNQPRPLYKGENPTDEEKIKAYDSFIANAGTYDVAGSTLTVRPTVARNPNFMAGGYVKYQFRVEGNALWLTSKTSDFNFRIGSRVGPLSGPSNETRMKLVRVE
ncbi:MAG: lipocalin-like domain-containing protein [Bacteroidota bacterium]